MSSSSKTHCFVERLSNEGYWRVGGANVELPAMIIITLIRHSDGRFSVTKNLGGGHGSEVLMTQKEAEALAAKMQAEAGGPSVAEIVRHDLTPPPGALKAAS
jgi:hypothetical protein